MFFFMLSALLLFITIINNNNIRHANGWSILLCFLIIQSTMFLIMHGITDILMFTQSRTNLMFFFLSLSVFFFSCFTVPFISSFPLSTYGLLFLSLYFISLHPLFTCIGIHDGSSLFC